MIKAAVFLIESESTVSELLCSWMKGWNFDVHTFKSLNHSTQEIDKQPDVLLIDLKEVNAESQKYVRSYENLNIPIVVIARYVDYDIIEKNNYFDICPFPCEPSHLKQIIKNASRYHQLYQDYLELHAKLRAQSQKNSSKMPNEAIDKLNVQFAQNIIPFEQLKKDAVKLAYEACNGNIFKASQKLKIGRATMYRLLHKYKLI